MKKHRVSIEYCTKCRWMIRASWMMQELLNSFEDELEEVCLKPGSVGGIFNVMLNDQLLWSRQQQGRFPDIVELKRLIRDVIAPDKSLGHGDQKIQKDEKA